jgi:hypothetical protein
MKKKFRNAASPYPIVFISTLFSKIFYHSNFIGKKFRVLGDVADYITWLKENFNEIKLFSSREALWSKNIDYLLESNKLKTSRFNKNFPILIIELGVAWGYATNWHVNKLSKYNFKYRGFDLFTGLPQKWRDEQSGAFSAEGKAPDINDPRVKFIKGDVAKTIYEIQDSELQDSQLLILFDLDLYEPSKEVFTYISQYLKSGDILYFDEAFDSDERQLICEEILEGVGPLKFKMIGATAFACSFIAEEMNGL